MKLRTILIFTLLTAAAVLPATTVEVIPAQAVIVHPENAGASIKRGAKELQKHIELITGVKVPLRTGDRPVNDKYSFLVGIRENGADPALAIAECRWIVGDKATYLYGDDTHNRRGSDYAVVNFLDSQLGIKWIEPGDDGIVFKPSTTLNLQSGKYKWIPKLLIRCIRCVEFPSSKIRGLEAFNKSPSEQQKQFAETRTWQYRMLLCHQTNMFAFGHAFTRWWSKYGKDHPEYFALNRSGRRAPETTAKNIYDPIAVGASARTIKMCVSNPAFARQILKNFYESSPRPEYINVCENDDVGGYCRCKSCLALDPIKNQKIDSNKVHLTDRYLHFVNTIAKEVAPLGTNVAWYAYNQTKNPPLREKVAPNIIIGTVPSMLKTAELDQFYREWKNCGATRFTLRPNYHWVLMHTAIPLGLEKHFYDLLDTAIKHGAIGADFDASQCHWSLNGITDYILFRKMGHPEKSFEALAAEYYSAYGDAAGDIEEYFKFFRNEIFEKRLRPRMDEICTRGRFNNFARGVLWDMEKYFSAADFDHTEAILKRAASRKLSPVEARRVKRLQLANEHSRLFFNAVTGKGTEKIAASIKLLNFRLDNRGKVKLDFNNFFRSERSTGGVETDAALMLKNFSANQETPLYWYAVTDEKNIGLKENWQAMNMTDARKKGFLLPTDSAWEIISDRHAVIDPDFKNKMKKYDGVVWYYQQIRIPAEWRNKEIYLCFGAVDESCELFVNGKASGAHPFIKPDDWVTPFALRIDQNINWNKPRQNIAVRVTDTGGNGGIWKRIWLVCK